MTQQSKSKVEFKGGIFTMIRAGLFMLGLSLLLNFAVGSASSFDWSQLVFNSDQAVLSPLRLPVLETDQLAQAHRILAAITGEFSTLCAEGYTGNGHRVHVCFAPGTPEEYVRKVMDRLYGDASIEYSRQARWTSTSYGGTGSLGNPIRLRWSFVPDGTWIPGDAGEQPGPSDLFARFDSMFGGNRTLWQNKFRESFQRWSQVCGVQYAEETDDGASFPGSGGQAGRRGDVRIAGHWIDGRNGILAYNYFPNTGDMVLDTAESWNSSSNNYRFLRNVVMHEHGHGLGLGHVTPTDCTKLMEPYLCTNFDGPQDDDIRGGQRNYGDALENNDSASTATDLGSGSSFSLQEVCLDATGDYDWYRFTAAASQRATINVTPIGTAYNNSRNIINLQLELRANDGTTVLASSTSGGVGQSEQITNAPLYPAGGPFLVYVYAGSGSINDVQRYTLSLTLQSVPTGDLNGDGCVNDSDLTQLLLDYGTNTPRSDIDGDGIVADSDLTALLLNYGQGC